VYNARAMNATAPGSPDLVIVIVNYNTCALLRDCLRSVYASELDMAQLPAEERGPSPRRLTLAACVVDNASPDDSVAMVRREFPQVQMIANEHNAGYPAANNQGLRLFGFGEAHLEATGDAETTKRAGAAERGEPGDRPGGGAGGLPRYALLLNPDTVLPPDALARMIAFIERGERIGVAGPKLVRLDGSLDKACRRSFPTPMTSLWHMLYLDRLFPKSPRFSRYNLSYLDPDEVTRVDAIVGAFMLVRGEAVAKAGLLDETFFMYGEDLDWAKRITDAGWEVWYYPKVTVLHIKEAASRGSYRARVEFYRAMNIFYDKHYRAATPCWLDWLIRGGVAIFGWADLTARRLRGQYGRTAL
jgi:N-acetylglucosaminyl-diphospho-decaprenol L-rhamnosyltransferase